MDDAVTIRLSAPIEAHGETIREVTFRAPLGRDLRDAGSARLPSGALDTAWDYRVIGACCNIPPSAIDGMPARDVIKLRAAFADFLADTTDQPSSTDISTAPAGGARSDTSST